MSALALILAGVSATLSVVLLGGLVELYRQVDQLRQQAGLVDQPIDLEFAPHVHLSELGLPRTDTPRELDGRFAILFLSDGCTTCTEVAAALPAKRTPNVLTLVEARNEQLALDWMARVPLQPDLRVLYDDDRRVAAALGVEVTPAAVRFERGRAVQASTVPSGGRLRELFDWVNSPIDDDETLDGKVHS